MTVINSQTAARPDLYSENETTAFSNDSSCANKNQQSDRHISFPSQEQQLVSQHGDSFQTRVTAQD